MDVEKCLELSQASYCRVLNKGLYVFVFRIHDVEGGCGLLLLTHLFLQLAELSGHGLQADPGLLELLMRGSHQVAAPVCRLTGVFQLTVEIVVIIQHLHLTECKESISYFLYNFFLLLFCGFS